MKHFEKNWLEWCVFGAGSVLVLAAIGYLVYQAVSSDDRPALVEVQLGAAERRGEEFAVPVTVINRGDESAETVLIEVRLITTEGKEERAQLQIQLLPGRARRDGWVTFGSDPTTATLTARAIGFESP